MENWMSMIKKLNKRIRKLLTKILKSLKPEIFQGYMGTAPQSQYQVLQMQENNSAHAQILWQ